METRSAKRRKRLSYESHEAAAAGDRISLLPKEIVHHIFSFLPLECIARTCVLSKFWRHMWYSYPKLDFTTPFGLRFVNGGRSWVDRVDRVLRLLEKRSDLTSLKIHGCASVSGLKKLMRVAFVKHNVQELDLNIHTGGGSFDLPPFIVESSALRDLTLYPKPSHMRLPPLDVMRNGFKSLGSLWLAGVNLVPDQPSILDLFTDSSFPSLTKLRLEYWIGLKHLRIQMSGLVDFHLRSCFGIQELDISTQKLNKLAVVDCFCNNVLASSAKIVAPLLESIVWSNAVTDECDIGEFDSLKDADVDFPLHHKDSSDSKMRSISNFLTGISRCYRLVLGAGFVEILSRSDHLATGLQWCVFDRLKSLELNIYRNITQKLASLFQCSPAAPVITISITSRNYRYDVELPEEIYKWESHAQSLLFSW